MKIQKDTKLKKNPGTSFQSIKIYGTYKPYDQKVNKSCCPQNLE